MYQLGYMMACNYNVHYFYSYSDKHTIEIAIIDDVILSNL